ncbi:biotin--[acetyl-CoA-carboxylase] ligase [Candidatus Dependentiae bacterium]|nr:biotin--[acetyl-CoA-carboxylase] ligase [Candidatus Dependentiae bacterium]
MIIGSKLYRIQTTDDSMAWARSLLHEAPDGALFLADMYTHARGRQGREWHIMPGQLLVTMVLKPPLLKVMHPDDFDVRLSQLNMAIALGVVSPLKMYGASLKWPNDIVTGTQKLGGILMQAVWEHHAPAGLIVGFALNVNNIFPPEHELYKSATSVCTLAGKQLDMRTLFKEIITNLDAWYAAWQQLAFGSIYKAWRQEQIYLGKPITVHQKDGSICTGIAQQVMPNGDLLLAIEGEKKPITLSFYQVEEIQLI